MKGVFIQFLKESFASQIDLFQNSCGELQIQQKLLSTPLHQKPSTIVYPLLFTYIYMDIYIIYIRIDILQKVRFTSYKQSLILELQRVFFSAMLSELQEFRNDKFFSLFLYVTKYYVQGHDLKMTLFSWLQ